MIIETIDELKTFISYLTSWIGNKKTGITITSYSITMFNQIIHPFSLLQGHWIWEPWKDPLAEELRKGCRSLSPSLWF